MNRSLLQTVLATTATKREATQYMQKYASDQLHKQVSLIRLSSRDNYSALDPLYADGLARMLKHMKELGSYPIVVLDGDQQIQSFLKGGGPTKWSLYEQQLLSISEKLSKPLANLRIDAQTLVSPFEMSLESGLQVNLNFLNSSLNKNQVPILLPLMYDLNSNESKFINSFTGCRQLVKSLKYPFNLDKVVFVDPLGGLPSTRRKHAAHVLVNLMQEFGEISAELRTNTINQQAHLENLNAMNEILKICGSHATGLITDPHSASTMLERNPIIYNLLTDRPLISPSLPSNLKRTQLKTSLLRTGFKVYVRHGPVTNPLDLYKEDKVGNINLTKLKRLFENSFKRKLDLDHYLNRLENSVAALIVVGDYDGVAVITYELGNNRKIPYLDKFVVDPSSQGAQGVADIMLIQMIRRMFPNEMLWRSRNNNPVNKWYFERSRGHLRLKDSNWTMFWICDGVPPIKEYEAVCRGIEPSLY